MINPLPKSQIFHTPEDWEELFGWIGQLTGAERVAATTAAMMAINLAHDLVDKAQLEQYTIDSTTHTGA